MPTPVTMTLIYKPVLTAFGWNASPSKPGTFPGVNPAQFASLTLDASVSETHSSEVDATDHPVETGANITDHARPKPDMLTIEGLVSNTPISGDAKVRAVNAFGVQLQTTAPVGISAQPGYAEQAYQQLLRLKDSGTLITIATALRTYDSMLMTSLSVPRDGKTGDALRFVATFKRIRLVLNKTSKVTVTDEPKAQGMVSKGTQSAKTVDPKSDENASLLIKADNAGLGGRIQKLFGVK